MIKNVYLQEIRSHIDTQVSNELFYNLITHKIRKEECRDLTLLSYRVYGTREMSDIIKIACGANSITDSPASGDIIYLPTMVNIRRIKRLFSEA